MKKKEGIEQSQMTQHVGFDSCDIFSATVIPVPFAVDDEDVIGGRWKNFVPR